MKARSAAAAALLMLSVPAAASAAVVTLQNITGTWSGALPSGPAASGFPAYLNNGTATPRVQWGVPASSGGPSHYEFAAVANPGVNFVVPPSPSPDQVLGTFSHHNFPINAPSLSSVVLTVSAQVIVDNVNQGLRNFVFDFTHDETTNSLNPCPYGGNNGQGVNINGCADRVSVSFSNLSDSFVVGGQVYTLTIKGFEQNGVLTNAFLTTEGVENDANLIANVTLRSTVQVPEPMALALFGLGLAGLGLLRRRGPGA